MCYWDVSVVCSSLACQHDEAVLDNSGPVLVTVHHEEQSQVKLPCMLRTYVIDAGRSM